MQQNQKKSEATSKKTSSVAKMMLQRDKNRLKEQQKHAYVELLKAPRGKEYLRLLAESTEIGKRLADVEEEIKKLEQELEQEAAMLPASDVYDEAEGAAQSIAEEQHWEEGTAGKPDEKIKVSWTQGFGAANAQTTQEIQSTKTGNVAWMKAGANTANVLQKIKDKQQQLMQMQRQRNELAEQFKTAQKAFIEQLPAPDKLVGMIYPGWNEEILMKYGVISCPGTAYSSPAELIEQVQPRTEEEERQWLKGDSAYRTYFCEELLIVEIYMDAVCVVYKDGNTKVIE